jgi:hypothetical protein
VSVIRVARRARFTTVSRETLNDGHLSFRARGILAWLLDKPDDWRVDSEQIADGGIEGRDAVCKALRELVDQGYMIRETERVEGGRFNTITTVFERPSLAKSPGQTGDGIPVGGATSGNDANGQVTPETGKPTTGPPTVGGPGALTRTVTEDCETPQPPSASKTCRRCASSTWIPDLATVDDRGRLIGDVLPCPDCNPDARPDDPRYSAEPVVLPSRRLRAVVDTPDLEAS